MLVCGEPVVSCILALELSQERGGREKGGGREGVEREGGRREAAAVSHPASFYLQEETFHSPQCT